MVVVTALRRVKMSAAEHTTGAWHRAVIRLGNDAGTAVAVDVPRSSAIQRRKLSWSHRFAENMTARSAVTPTGLSAISTELAATRETANSFGRNLAQGVEGSSPGIERTTPSRC